MSRKEPQNRDMDVPYVGTATKTSVRVHADASSLRRRHYGILTWFFITAVLPTITVTAYLFTVANDQYSSRVSFSIRSEEISNPLEALSGIGKLSTGSSSEADIVYEYILSQRLVQDLKQRVDVEQIFTKPEFDPVFAMKAGQPIEEILKYWKRMTHVIYDPGTGLIDIEVFAFDPDDAHRLANAVLDASSELVNRLSSIARSDRTRYSKYELEQATQRLKSARLNIRQWRDQEGIVDPSVNLETQMGILTALQEQLATELINLDLLADTTGASDPRIEQSNRKIAAINERITQEQEKVASGNDRSDKALAAIVGSYEALVVDREFAEQAYTAAAAAYDAAISEARRKSRYLAAHVPPTIAESSQYPKRYLLSAVTLSVGVLIWLLTTLIYYAARDRR